MTKCDDSTDPLVATDVGQLDICYRLAIRSGRGAGFCVQVWCFVSLGSELDSERDDLPLWQTPVYSTFARTSFRPGVGTG